MTEFIINTITCAKREDLYIPKMNTQDELLLSISTEGGSTEFYYQISRGEIIPIKYSVKFGRYSEIKLWEEDRMSESTLLGSLYFTPNNVTTGIRFNTKKWDYIVNFLPYYSNAAQDHTITISSIFCKSKYRSVLNHDLIQIKVIPDDKGVIQYQPIRFNKASDQQDPMHQVKFKHYLAVQIWEVNKVGLGESNILLGQASLIYNRNLPKSDVMVFGEQGANYQLNWFLE